MQTIVIHCKPELLTTIHDNDLDWCYSETQDYEIDVNIPYTNHVEKVNNELDTDQEFVEYFGLDYDLVNCIELLD